MSSLAGLHEKKDDGNYNDMIKVAIYKKGREAMNIKVF